MKEEMLENVSGTLFPDRDETQISDRKATSLFVPPVDDEQPKLVFSESELARLADFRNTSALDSNSELAKLVDDAIGQNRGSTNGKVPNPPNDASPKVADDSKIAELSGVPEEGAGGKNDKKDDSDTDGKTIEGTDDDDIIVATGANQSLYGKKGKDKLKGKSGKNKLYGGKDDDDCAGGDGDDEIKGDRGDDKCDGGQGNDTISGGKDNDTLSGGTGNDTVMGDDGNDWVHGNEGNDDVDGGSGNDTVYGGKGNDKCEGGEGNDAVRGDRGEDNVSGGEGNDTVNGGKDNDTVIGGAGNDVCMGDDGDDTVMGGTGDDTVMGGAGNDNVSGDEGDDSVVGGEGKDTLSGGAGNDVCSGDEGDDSIVGGSGDDTLMGGSGNDTLVTGDGNDMADGGDGDDSVVGGGSGNDTLMGNAGNDTIVGGTGNHTCIGGAGNDVFVMSNMTAPGSSVITDYTAGSDKFLLSGDLNFSSLSFVQVGLNTEIRGSNNFVLAILLNINATIIKAGEFLGVTAPTTTTTPARPLPVASAPTPTTAPTPTPTPTPDPLSVVANEPLSVGSSGSQTIITSALLKVVDGPGGPSGTVFKLTELPDAKTGQLFFKGVAVTAIGVTFTQADINGGLLTFQAVSGFTGKADISFGFEFSQGTTVITGKRFSLKVEQTTFDFTGSTAPQVIVGSATLDNDIKGGDGDDDIKGGNKTNKIKANKGNDKIQGGDGDNDIDGGDGDDTIIGGKGKNKIKGGNGKNKIKGGDGDNDIEGGDDDDDIEGGKGKNKLIGGIGNDKIQGGDGDSEIDGGEGTNTLIGGTGKDRFIYRTSREKIKTVAEADLITDFNVDDDVLDLSAAAFGNLSVASLTRLAITATSVVGSIGSNNLLDFSADISVTSIATLQARFAALGGNTDAPVFCQFTDATTGRSVLVFAVGVRFEVIASFSIKISLQVKNFVFTGPALNVPVGTSGPDNFNFGTYPAAVNFDGLGGDDNIVGSNFNDTIKGGDGNDTITGGLGADVLSGGSGTDLFVYTTTKEGGDKITDFKSGTDKLQFSASEFGNLTSTNFVSVSGSTPDITGKQLVIFTGGTYASVEAAQAKALGSSTTPGFFAFTNASNETVLVFDSNGTVAGGSTIIANLGTAAGTLGTADFVFTGSIAASPTTPAPTGSIADLNAAGNTFPIALNNFGSGAGGYNFSTPVLFTGDAAANSVTGTEFADILNGGLGADILSGGSGADTLNGGIGADILTGGTGADIFVYNAPGDGGDDRITDFAFGVDKLQFVSGAFGNLTTTNFVSVSGSTPDITGKQLVIFTGGTYASVEAAQAKALGSSTTPGFFAFTNASNETVLVFDSNGTVAGGSTIIANLGTAAGTLGTADFVFTGSIAASPTTPAPTGSIADLNAAGNTFPIALNNFGSVAGGYNFSTPVLFTGDGAANSVTGTQFADILNGAGGADILTGGSGADVLTGGAGADIFVYKAPGEGGDSITDFAFGVDKFQFVASEFGNLTTTNFDGVSGSTPDITGKELVIFTGGTFASLELAQAKALGNSTTPGFFVYTNAANETVLAFDSNGTTQGGFTKVASLGTAAGTLGTADFVFTGTIAASPTTPAPTGSIANLTAAGNTFPIAFNNFGSVAGGYNFSTPVLFTGNASANSVTGTEFADIITGGGGADILTGGSGADIFGYNAPGDGADTITDFTFGVDKLQFVSGAFGNFTTTNFASVSGSTPDITGKQLVIFTGANYSTVDAAQTKAVGSSTTPGFFVFTNTSSETVLVFDSNGTIAGGFTTVANLGTAAGTLGTADFLFTGATGSAPTGTSTNSGSIVDLTANPGTFPTTGVYNFGSGVGGYNFTTPVLFTGNSTVANNVTGTEFSDILNGGSGADIFDGGAGNDSIFGGAGNDSLNGGAGNDYLIGGDGNDSLVGGPGADTLIGGSGNDSFYYNNFGEGGLGTNVDQIGDFVVGQDKFILQLNSFPGLSAVPNTDGLSSKSFLVLQSGFYNGSSAPAGAAPSDAFLFYENETGRLGFDPDGIAGANPGVTLAILNGKPGVTASDVALI